jgi:hypothetical protein
MFDVAQGVQVVVHFLAMLKLACDQSLAEQADRINAMNRYER